jgi:hypothetical protein
MRDLGRLHVPDPGEFLDVRVVLPVAEAGQVAVRAALAGVLRSSTRLLTCTAAAVA